MDDIHFISAHRYSSDADDTSDWFLAEGVEIQRIIDDYLGLLSYVRGRRRSNRQVYLGFDGWNT